MTGNKRHQAQFTLKTWKPIGAGPTNEEKNLQRIVDDIVYSPTLTPIQKYTQLHQLALARPCQNCDSTIAIRFAAEKQWYYVDWQRRVLENALLEKHKEVERLEKEYAELAVSKFIVKSTLTSYTKDFRSDFSIQKAADGFYYVAGYVTDGSIDRENDRMSGRALKSMEEAMNAGMNLYSDHNHGWKDTIGKFVQARLDGIGLWAKARLEDPEKNPDVALLLHKLEIGEKLGFSIGADMDGHRYIEEKDASGQRKKIREISNVKLYEVSVVGLPANANAYIQTVTRGQ